MRFVTGLAVLSAVAVLTLPVAAAAADIRGVTATEIRIGQTMPYSGPGWREFMAKYLPEADPAQH